MRNERALEALREELEELEEELNERIADSVRGRKVRHGLVRRGWVRPCDLGYRVRP